MVEPAEQFSPLTRSMEIVRGWKAEHRQQGNGIGKHRPKGCQIGRRRRKLDQNCRTDRPHRHSNQMDGEVGFDRGQAMAPYRTSIRLHWCYTRALWERSGFGGLGFCSKFGV